MRIFVCILTIMLQQSFTLFQFNSKCNIEGWKILDDVVMGGVSNGNFKLNSSGYGEYSGKVSLENNGGFSSLRYSLETINSSDYSKFKLRIKGNGKTYQFRVKDSHKIRYSYVYEFKTSSNWETIEIPFKDMYPSFRGNRLNIPNYKGTEIAEIAFLIGNKKEEDFKLLIDSIVLE